MLLSLFGTPSPLTYWILHLLRTTVQVLYSEHSVVHVFRPDDVWTSWSEITSKVSPPLILFSDCPEGRLCDLMLSMGAPIIVSADEAIDAVSYLVASREMRTEHALRVFSQCVSSLEILSKASEVLNVRNELYHQPVTDCVHAVAAFCKLPVEKHHVSQILVQLMTDYQTGSDHSVGREILAFVPQSRWPGRYDVLDSGASALTAAVGEQYGAIIRNEPLQQLVWPRNIFPNFDDPERFLNGAQQMLGRARYLVLGPYFHLPRGDWNVSVEIEVTQNLSGNEIRAELVSGNIVVSGITAALPTEGAFVFEMRMTVEEPFLPIEVRIFMLYGAIEGLFLLRNVRFDRSAGRPPQGRDAELDRPSKTPLQAWLSFPGRHEPELLDESSAWPAHSDK